MAVTGALAAGKSSVCRFFAECGAYVVNCDSIVHHLLEVSSTLIQQVVDLLGEGVRFEGRLDRGAIAKCVFADPKLATALERLVHPHVHHALEVAYQTCVHQAYMQGANYLLFVAEVPLLYEVGWERDFDFVIAVLADAEQCRERFRRSFPFDSDAEGDRAYFQRMACQMDPQEKAHRADCVLVNETTDQDLRKAVQELYKTLTGST